MLGVNRLIKKSFDKQVDGSGLAIFRIVYSIVLLGEISQMFFFRHLIFDKVPYLELAEINFSIPIGIWFISVLFILFGCFTRFFTIINYILTLILIGSITTFEYHVFYTYLGINFILIFSPISQTYSFDRLFKKLKYSNTTFQYQPSTYVSQLYYLLLLFVGIGMVYFDSIFHKLDSNTWLSGLGMWLPASLPVMAQNNLSSLLNLKWLMLFLGYLTLFFEIVFVFLFFRKKLRLPLFIIGFGLHIGILIAFPIPFFGLTFCSLYLLLIPLSFWKNILKRRFHKEPQLIVYYDVECPLCIRTKIIVSHFNSNNNIIFKTVQFDSQENESLIGISMEKLLDDIHSVDRKGTVYNGIDTYIKIFNNIWYFKPLSWLMQLPGINYFSKKVYNYIANNRNTVRCTEENCGYDPPKIVEDNTLKLLQNFTLKDLKFTLLKYLITILILFQFGNIYNSPVVNFIKEKIEINETYANNLASDFFKKTSKVSKILFGVTKHAVFIDDHFKDFNHNIAVTFLDHNKNEIWLPMVNKIGLPENYNQGFNWAKYSFRTNSQNINNQDLENGIRDYSAFWAFKNNIDLKNAKFFVKVKKMKAPTKWEKDFLNNQLANPWIDGGYVIWKEFKMESFIKDIENL